MTLRPTDYSIRTRLLAGFAAVSIVLAASVSYTMVEVGKVSDVIERLVNRRVPVALATQRLESQALGSLAALRGYLLTGSADAKSDRIAIWKDMDKSIADFDNYAKSFLRSENTERWKAVRTLLDELRTAQDRIEQLAFTPDAYPATKLLTDDAAPRAEKILASLTSMINDESSLEATEARKRILKSLADARGNFSLSVAQLRLFLLTGTASVKDPFSGYWGRFTQAISDVEAQKSGLTPSQLNSLEVITTTLREFAPLPLRLFEIRESGQWNVPVHLLATQAAPRATKVLDLLVGPKGADGRRSGGIRDDQVAGLQADADLASIEIASLRFTELVLLGIGLILSAAVAFLMASSIAKPVRGMTDAMASLAKGNHEVEVPATSNKDEIGEMAQAVLVFRDAAIEKARMEREAEAERIRNQEAQQTAEKEAINRERLMVTQSIGAGMTRLAAKDLTFRLTDDMPEAYRKLQADFNAAMEEIERAIEGVRTGADGIKSGTSEIAQASDDLSRRTEAQAANLEETTAAVTEITSTVARTAQGAGQARTVVASAKAEAEKGGEVVRRAVESITDIEKSSKEIAQIIGVIDEIAFQTNLLALNAGVEAARAGDAGRGFAVVASEVRALAQRSAEAAKQIKELISKSSTQVGDGVELVRATGIALDRIVASVAQINTVIIEIAAGAEHQATGLGEVSAAVGQMDQVTQQNAAMVEEATAATCNLAKQSDELARLVGSFQTSSRSATDSFRDGLRKVAPHAFAAPTGDNGEKASAARSNQATGRRPGNRSKVVAVNAAGRGGAAALASADDWEEF